VHRPDAAQLRLARGRALTLAAFARPQPKAGAGEKKGAAKEAPRYRSDVQKLFAQAQAVQARPAAAPAAAAPLFAAAPALSAAHAHHTAGRQPAEAQDGHREGARAPVRHARRRQHRQVRFRMLCLPCAKRCVLCCLALL
jgi:hypothetical protein